MLYIYNTPLNTISRPSMRTQLSSHKPNKFIGRSFPPAEGTALTGFLPCIHSSSKAQKHKATQSMHHYTTEPLFSSPHFFVSSSHSRPHPFTKLKVIRKSHDNSTSPPTPTPRCGQVSSHLKSYINRACPSPPPPPYTGLLGLPGRSHLVSARPSSLGKVA